MRKKNQHFAKDVVRLASGTAAAQALNVLAAPIVTRLYGPVAYGISALFVSITTVGVAVSCLRYELAIPLSESDEEGASLLALSIISCALVTAASALLLLVAGRPLLIHLRASELLNCMWFIPIAILLGGSVTALNYWMTRQAEFGALARARVTRSGTIVAWQLAAGYGGYATAINLIVANVTGSLAAGLFLVARIWRRSARVVFSGVRWHQIRSGAKRYRKFPIYSTWSTLLNTLSWQLPTLLLSYFFSPKIVGYYALSASLLGLPMNLLGNSVAQVFYQAAAAAHAATGELGEVVEGAFRQLVQLAMFPLLLLALVGKDLFQIAFGPQWAEAGVYCQILSVWIFFWFISSPLSTVLSVLERQEFDLKLNVLLITTRLIALGVGGYVGDARLAVALFSAFGVLVYGYSSFVFLRMAKVRVANALRTLLNQVAIFLPAAVVLLGLDILGVNEWARVGAAAVSFAVFAWVMARKYRLIGALRERLGLA